MFSKSILAAAALLGISAVEAHMIMTEPIPYGKDTLNNSPLAADGSDFPCKLRSNTYEVTEWNTAQIGESMPLTFEGSATHGGGSCQVSLTTDLQPTKDSEWMVIKSIEGGCPANVDGNLSGGASMADPTKFNYTIPDGISPGKYTLAWTWFNRIGNREMYMNCAPLEVQSASSKRSDVEEKRDVEKRSSTFPPMFVANVNGCTTSEGVDIRFPQPGDDIQYNGEPSNLASAGAAACTGTPTFAAAVLRPLLWLLLPRPQTPTLLLRVEGEWNCINGSSFQRCANGQWTPAQNVAAGTQCTAGQSSNLAISAIKLKPRTVREGRARRHAHGGHVHA
ncbi:Heterokaryon incompatibility protein (HET) family protein [Aspergillus niger]|uniref:Heterokaryon incompatibility protein (HET) family protein n=1 Tax=Aspergillus niger TaxID=5061 RepID=A0A505IFI5_ASPNG|nr:Heterokaryon incompatibility protein (HET) family protein [Aspergillus niger]